MLQKGEFANVCKLAVCKRAAENVCKLAKTKAFVVLPYYMKEREQKNSFLFLLSLF
jgi:hypothetical protein